MLLAFAFIGIVLQVLGLLIAVSGLGQTYRQITNRSLVNDLLAVRFASQRRQHRRTVMLSGTATATLTTSAEARLTPGDPGESAPVDKQIVFLRRYVEILVDRIDEVSTSTDESLGRVNRKLSDLRFDTTQRLDDAEEKHSDLLNLVFGQEGQGLLRTAEGLIVTLIGVIFAAFGLPWS